MIEEIKEEIKQEFVLDIINTKLSELLEEFMKTQDKVKCNELKDKIEILKKFKSDVLCGNQDAMKKIYINYKKKIL